MVLSVLHDPEGRYTHRKRGPVDEEDLKVRIRRAVCLGPWELRAQDIRLGESIGKSGCIEVRKGSFEKDGKFTEASVTTVSIQTCSRKGR
ncbi:hypothetical protein ANCDUO_19011 [Ancylostoma duodenale]|uniref:Uncharacterized protein n=1 Tax=Ancylostoma duodenale TaxID=51022 RepID=A0A0C2G1I6_9BILA|nr:hypothetical protein ANCDUO_19011 [Ancylostoma duodenale]